MKRDLSQDKPCRNDDDILMNDSEQNGKDQNSQDQFELKKFESKFNSAAKADRNLNLQND